MLSFFFYDFEFILFFRFSEVKGNSKCIALYNYDGGSIHDQLNLIEGEELTVIEKGPEWTKGQKGDRIGFFPTSYVEFYN